MFSRGRLLSPTSFSWMTIGGGGFFSMVVVLGCGTRVLSPHLWFGKMTIKIISRTNRTSISGVTLISDDCVLRAPTIIDMAWLLSEEITLAIPLEFCALE